MDQSLSSLYLQNPEAAIRMRRMQQAQAQMQQGSDTSPIRSHWEGAARLAQALMGGLSAGRIDGEARGEADKFRTEAAAWDPMGNRGGPLAASLQAPQQQAQAEQPAPPAAQPAAPAAPQGGFQGSTLGTGPSEPPRAEPAGPLSGALAQYRPQIEAASARTGIPVGILTAQLMAESGGKADAIGDQGHRNGVSRGLMQVQEATARNPGYGVAPVDPAKLMDPTTNINFGADYMAARAKAAGVTNWQDPAQAQRGLASYNGSGPQADAYGRRVYAASGVGMPAGGGVAARTGGTDMAGPGVPAAPQQPAPQQPQATAPGMDINAMAAQVAQGLSSPNPMIRQKAEAMARVLPMLRAEQDRATERGYRVEDRRDANAREDTRTAEQRAWQERQSREAAAREEARSREERAFRERQNPPDYRVNEDGSQSPVPGGRADPAQLAVAAKARAEGQPPPQQITGAMLENVAGVRKIDETLAALDARSKRGPDGKVDPTTGEGVGWSGYVPGVIHNRTDPEGVTLRALIADIGSLKLHDRSGANVTASEAPRLTPFIPSVTDDPATVRSKLGNFRREYLNALQDQYSVFGPAGGGRALAPVDAILNPKPGAAAPQQGGGWSIRPVQ